MGSPLRQQRRGKGGPNYRSNREGNETSHRRQELEGEVIDLVHDSSRSAPVALVEFEDGEDRAIVAPENLAVGDKIELGVSAPIEAGNTLPLAEIPEGVPIYNIEIQPNDGGKMVKSSGTYAFVVTHEQNSTRIKLPSGEFKKMNKDCRATIGKVAAGGRKDKPFVKAGNKSKAMHAKGLPYPKVSGVAMNAVDHPFGGSAKPGKAKTVSRHASPGRKVGNIAAKRSGKNKE
ncbi:MAG: 50S ribosomal protein L2 [Candidatus Nanohaloarchaea archaeon]